MALDVTTKKLIARANRAFKKSADPLEHLMTLKASRTDKDRRELGAFYIHDGLGDVYYTGHELVKRLFGRVDVAQLQF
jgi:hypothetical protein